MGTYSHVVLALRLSEYELLQEYMVEHLEDEISTIFPFDEIEDVVRDYDRFSPYNADETYILLDQDVVVMEWYETRWYDSHADITILNRFLKTCNPDNWQLVEDREGEFYESGNPLLINIWKTVKVEFMIDDTYMFEDYDPEILYIYTGESATEGG